MRGRAYRLLGGEATLAWEQRDGGLAVRLQNWKRRRRTRWRSRRSRRGRVDEEPCLARPTRHGVKCMQWGEPGTLGLNNF